MLGDEMQMQEVLEKEKEKMNLIIALSTAMGWQINIGNPLHPFFAGYLGGQNLNSAMTEMGVWDNIMYSNLPRVRPESYEGRIEEISIESERNRLAGLPPTKWTIGQIHFIRELVSFAIGAYFIICASIIFLKRENIKLAKPQTKVRWYHILFPIMFPFFLVYGTVDMFFKCIMIALHIILLYFTLKALKVIT